MSRVVFASERRFWIGECITLGIGLAIGFGLGVWLV